VPQEVNEEEREVEITRRFEWVDYPKIGMPVEMIGITYVAPPLPPRTLNIEKEKFTEDKLPELIREDIKKWKLEKPTTIKV